MRYKPSEIGCRWSVSFSPGVHAGNARREDAAAKRSFPLPPSPFHLGVTLIEMLIVIAIIAILAVAGARTMQPALEGRRIREAARAVNVYLGVARNHALATGRPCGVLIRRFPGLEECSMVLEQVEQPAPYGGDTIGATAQLQIGSIAGGFAPVSATFTPAISTALVQEGDLVQFNHQGPFYEVAPGGVPTGATTTLLTLRINVSQGQILPWPSGPLSDPVPYKIFRRPTKTAVGPLQLPTGTVIDLLYSGTEPSPTTIRAFGISKDIYIMFSPNGSVDRLYSANINGRVVNPIFLLIGKRENIPDVPNWSDFTNLWIAINPQTGLITTAEVASDSSIDDSRDFARQAQSMGGR